MHTNSQVSLLVKTKHAYIRKCTHAQRILNLLANTLLPLNTHTPSDIPTHWGQRFGHRQHSILLLRLQWKNLLFDPEYFQHFQLEESSQGMPCFSAKRARGGMDRCPSLVTGVSSLNPTALFSENRCFKYSLCNNSSVKFINHWYFEAFNNDVT